MSHCLVNKTTCYSLKKCVDLVRSLLTGGGCWRDSSHNIEKQKGLGRTGNRGERGMGGRKGKGGLVGLKGWELGEIEGNYMYATVLSI